MPAAIVTRADVAAGPAIVSRLDGDGFSVATIPATGAGERSDLGRLVAAACEEQSVAVLVNNAPAFASGRVLDTPTDTFAAGLEAGLSSVFSACREAASIAARRHEHLTIINVVSVLGFVGLPSRSIEACSSAGVMAATKALAAEWGPLGIRVKAVVVGPTSDWDDDTGGVPGVIPLQSFVAHDDVAAAVSSLARSDAGAVDGSPLIVDNGWLAYGYREDSP